MRDNVVSLINVEEWLHGKSVEDGDVRTGCRDAARGVLQA